MRRALIIALLLLPACSKKLTADAIEKSPAAIVQQNDHGTSTWIVRPDGAVSATLKDADGKPITGAVTGEVTFKAPDGTPTTVPVQYDPKQGVLSATGPKLDADLTPMSYSVIVDGKPWIGSLDVPRNGTEELVETAKLQPSLPAGTLAPHGGVVQVVGPDRVELVANKANGDVRAYVLDANNKPIDPGDRKITVSLHGDQPEVLVLSPEPQAHYVIGHMRARVDPINVTVAVSDHGTTHACLVGFSPGAVLIVGPAAPRVHLLADGWPGEVAPGVVVDVGAPGIVVGGPGHWHGDKGWHGDHDRGGDRDHDHGGHRGH